MILYVRNNCSACKNVEAFFAEQGIHYDEVNVQEPEGYGAGMNLVNAGIRSLPVLELADGERLIGAAAIKSHF